MGRIAERFARLAERREAALVPFVMAGDPDLDTTRALLRAAAAAGADLVEIGVPFSDPTADGPILQRSAARALARGTSLRGVLALVAELRDELPMPVVLFGYYNPIFHYGTARFAEDARRAGVDGLLVVDLPPEEADEVWKPSRAAGLDVIFLLAPTSDSGRVRAVLRKASGFVYFVSMTGITGSRAIDSDAVREKLGELRRLCALPLGVGFGISTAEEAAAVASYADAVIVGSAIMRMVESEHGSPEVVERVGTFIRELKEATRKPAPVAA
jgi:tryptophan synthase alpha chain